MFFLRVHCVRIYIYSTHIYLYIGCVLIYLYNYSLLTDVWQCIHWKRYFYLYNYLLFTDVWLTIYIYIGKATGSFGYVELHSRWNDMKTMAVFCFILGFLPVMLCIFSVWLVVWKLLFFEINSVYDLWTTVFRAHCRCHGWDDCASDFFSDEWNSSLEDSLGS